MRLAQQKQFSFFIEITRNIEICYEIFFVILFLLVLSGNSHCLHEQQQKNMNDRFVTCQQPILNSESTNFFHTFFLVLFLYDAIKFLKKV